MTWEPELEELRQRQAFAREMGGPEKIARQRAAGRLTVRERIDALLDAGSFREIGSITGNGAYDEAGALTAVTPTNFLFGRGTVDGSARCGRQATTSRCAAARPMRRSSRSRWPRSRWRTNCACRWSASSKAAAAAARSSRSKRWRYTYVPFLPGFEHMVRNLATVPVISLGLGPVAGFGAAQVVQQATTR